MWTTNPHGVAYLAYGKVFSGKLENIGLDYNDEPFLVHVTRRGVVSERMGANGNRLYPAGRGDELRTLAGQCVLRGILAAPLRREGDISFVGDVDGADGAVALSFHGDDVVEALEGGIHVGEGNDDFGAGAEDSTVGGGAENEAEMPLAVIELDEGDVAVGHVVVSGDVA